MGPELEHSINILLNQYNYYNNKWTCGHGGQGSSAVLNFLSGYCICYFIVATYSQYKGVTIFNQASVKLWLYFSE